MKLFFASDHAGFELKKELIHYARNLGYVSEDLGPKELNPNDDYPLLIEKAALEIFKEPNECKAVVIGMSGQGEAIVANRFPNVRAVVYYGGNKEIIKLSREHNDSNVLSLGAGFLSVEEAKKALELWLDTRFSGDKRHIRRLEEIDQLEESLYKNP